MVLGFYSYLGAALAYSFFVFLLVFSLRESLQGKLLFVVMLTSACWSFFSIKMSLNYESYLLAYRLSEVIRYIVWYVFLLKLFDSTLPAQSRPDSVGSNNSYQRFVRWALPFSTGFAGLLLCNIVLDDIYALPGQFTFEIAGMVILALIGLAIIEQLYRNTSIRYRWNTKFLFFGVGGIFAYDFYFYADALLFQGSNADVWEARGLVHVIAVPLLIISSARNKNWSLNIFVSRDIVLNSTAFLGGGIYLLAMTGAGYYLKEFGGSWGRAGQIAFVILALVFLFSILSSAQLKAQLRVFLAKHFYKNKYDYRTEWLRLTENLNDKTHDKRHFQTAIEAMANMVDARGGWLWLCDKNGQYENIDVWQLKLREEVVSSDSSLIKFLTKKNFVINMHELELDRCADEYSDLQMPEWFTKESYSWLIVPLRGNNELLGFVVLANPLVARVINWEDRDLLKTAAKQIASYLTVVMTSAQLAEAKQFEVFTRLSAYMVHDLKNIAAELQLIAINAKKYAGNPAFIEDAFETVDNASGDINRLLEQLRNRRALIEKKVLINLVELVNEVISTKQNKLPVPQLRVHAESALVPLEKGRLYNVLAHLIDNAQQATADNGEVMITLSSTDGMCTIEIKDDGHGMDEDFVSNRLFKPFDTTKGNAGMGIGMYESQEFIRQLGGDIVVQSEPEKGSIITLHIPMSAADSD